MIEKYQNNLGRKSYYLAERVHQNMVEALGLEYGIIDRKIKKEVTQLSFGSEIPSILIELGFLTNEKEAYLLSNKKYQKKIATLISKGLDDFFNMD